jgi:uncharacterized protein (DUF2147 family)
MTMKRLIAFATLLLASSAAHAGDSYSFELGGRTIHIDAPSGCDSPSCVSISIPGIYESDQKRTKRARATPQAAPQAKANPQAKADSQPRVEPQAAPKAKTEPPPQMSSGTSPAPAITATAINAPSAPAASPRASEPAQSQPAAGPVVAAAPVSASAPVQQQQVPAPPASRPAASPLGTWQTEEKEGLVRIEACGSNLCGYSVDAKTNQNGEKILINMRSVNDAKWTGRIQDPKSGSNYDSTIALKGPDSIHVQGCAFGGMFCGGQTWSRVN